MLPAGPAIIPEGTSFSQRRRPIAQVGFDSVFLRTSSARFFQVDVIAEAAGFGMEWQRCNLDAQPAPVEIHLRPEQLVRGRLVDVRGQLAAGLPVTVVQLAIQSDGQLNGVGFGAYAAAPSPWPAPVTTDEQGRFAVRGAGSGVAIEIQIRDPRFARQEIVIQPQPAGDQEVKTFVLTPATSRSTAA